MVHTNQPFCGTRILSRAMEQEASVAREWIFMQFLHDWTPWNILPYKSYGASWPSKVTRHNKIPNPIIIESTDSAFTSTVVVWDPCSLWYTLYSEFVSPTTLLRNALSYTPISRVWDSNHECGWFNDVNHPQGNGFYWFFSRLAAMKHFPIEFLWWIMASKSDATQQNSYPIIALQQLNEQTVPSSKSLYGVIVCPLMFHRLK